MRNLPASAPATAPRQLSMALDSVRLRGMSSSERRAVLARLAGLLLEALALPEAVLKRKAVVYVRQSTQAQSRSISKANDDSMSLSR